MNVTAAVTVISLDLIDSEDDTDITVKDGIQRTVISKLHQYYQISNLIDTALYSVDDEALLQPRSVRVLYTSCIYNTTTYFIFAVFTK